MTLILLRHGQTDWNVEPARCQGWRDVGLNEAGRTQARARGRALRGRGVGLVVTSHLRRARETAELVRAELVEDEGRAGAGRRRAVQGAGRASPGPGAPPLVVDPRLAEAHRGRWEGRLFADIVAEEPVEWRAYRERPGSFRFPGGESLTETQRRVLAALRDAAQDGRTILVVTHGGPVRLARCAFDGRGIETFHSVTADTGSVHELAGQGLCERVAAALLGNP